MLVKIWEDIHAKVEQIQMNQQQVYFLFCYRFLVHLYSIEEQLQACCHLNDSIDKREEDSKKAKSEIKRTIDAYPND